MKTLKSKLLILIHMIYAFFTIVFPSQDGDARISSRSLPNYDSSIVRVLAFAFFKLSLPLFLLNASDCLVALYVSNFNNSAQNSCFLVLVRFHLSTLSYYIIICFGF